jgi:hypothetical protein
MKTAAKKITLFFWLAIAAFQPLFAAQLAPAKSALGLENRAWKFFSLAPQLHQPNVAQVSEPQRERAPPQVKEASDELLAPESETVTWGDFAAQAQAIQDGVKAEYGDLDAFNMARTFTLQTLSLPPLQTRSKLYIRATS